jgi:SNF2 family DNA or RNA helicase
LVCWAGAELTILGVGRAGRRYLVVDEGHRLKNRQARLVEALSFLQVPRRVLLTGTPIQNNTLELFTLLNFIQPRDFPSAELFVAKFGDLRLSSQVSELQDLIRPFILRRMKANVERSIPPKEETIIDIELTSLQKIYYRAIFERNLKFLKAGCTAASMPRLVNIEMQARSLLASTHHIFLSCL